MTPVNGDIVVGALVQWTGAKTYGVVTKIDERMIYVRWDEDVPPPQFALPDPPLSRVVLQHELVQRRSTGEGAVVRAPAASGTPLWKCVVTNGGGTFNVPEADLRPVAVTDPVGRFKAGLVGSLQQYRLQEVTRWYR